jgi:hypothetical protein
MLRLFSLCALALGLLLPAAVRAQLNLNVYGDVGGHLEHAADTSHSFSAPHVEFLPSGSAGDFSFLAEVNFEIGDNNTFDASAERLEVAYLVDDRLRLRAGRFHTAIGYYNDAYHHGTYFLLPTDRPLWLDFEDGGGLIPSHSVGVHADGRFNFAVGGLRYDLDLANGRGRRLVEVQNLTDDNKTKAFNVRLRFEPEFLPGLVLGANLYVDRIAANAEADLPAPIPEMDERMLGIHAAYLEGCFHLITEAAFFSHDETRRSKSYSTQAYLVEVGYEVGAVTPYAVFERVSFGDEVSPYFLTSPLGEAGSQTLGRAGVKWKVGDHLAVKLEAGRQAFDRAGSTANDFARFQAAFAF